MDTLAVDIVQGLQGNVPAWLLPVLTIVGIYIRHAERRKLKREHEQEKRRLLNGTP